MQFSEELIERGFVHQCSADNFAEVVDGEKRTIYLGIDPTGDSMHVGHLVPYMLLNHFLKNGHSVILLLGGGTALIGDPSGKDKEREFVDEKVVAERCSALEQKIRAITVSDSVQFLNNYTWLSSLSMIAFLRDIGKHFTVNAMMKKDSVATRLASEQGISYTEFSYSLLQSYDFYHLHKEYGCTLQIGASDQWGNISSGIDYIRRKTGKTVYGLTMPLLINPTTGKKFGKSEGNAIWLDAEKTSPFAFYQFWLNTSDEHVVSYLKLFTFLPLEKIAEISSTHEADPSLRIAQQTLAEEVTMFVHGDLTSKIKEVSELLFGETSIVELDTSKRELLRTHAPAHQVEEGTLVSDMLVATSLASSKREARSFIESGAVLLNGEKITEATAMITEKDFTEGVALVRRGKKHVAVLTHS